MIFNQILAQTKKSIKQKLSTWSIGTGRKWQDKDLGCEKYENLTHLWPTDSIWPRGCEDGLLQRQNQEFEAECSRY